MIFEGSQSSCGSKINFVDENDVYVGYDMSQDWCEHADWFIVDEPQTADTINTDTNHPPVDDLTEYRFDREYFEQISGSDLDEGGMAIFKLINEDGDAKYLHLFNNHNGYYGHGFEVKHGGVIIESGSL